MVEEKLENIECDNKTENNVTGTYWQLIKNLISMGVGVCAGDIVSKITPNTMRLLSSGNGRFDNLAIKIGMIGIAWAVSDAVETSVHRQLDQIDEGMHMIERLI